MRVGLRILAGGIAALAALVPAGCGGDEAQPAAPEATSTPLAQEPARAEAAPEPAAAAGPGEEEIRRLRAAYDADPENEEHARLLAIALFDSSRTDEALRIFETAAASSPSVGNLLNLGRAYMQVSRYPEAEQVYQRALAIAPENPLALHALGNLATRVGNPEAAVGYYRRAIAARPGYLLAWFHLGDALKDAGNYREAYETYAHVLDLEPQNQQEVEVFDDALYEMASLDITMGAHARAAQMLEELIRASPEHRAAYYAYGQALLQLGRVEEAQQAFQKHMEILARSKQTGPAAMGE